LGTFRGGNGGKGKLSRRKFQGTGNLAQKKKGDKKRGKKREEKRPSR